MRRIKGRRRPRILFDIEANGFWPQVDTVWLLQTMDLDTGETREYSDYDDDLHGTLEEGLEYLHTAKLLVGHFITSYDLPVLEQLKEWKPQDDCKIHDTLIMSQVLRYKRPHRHSLEGWGKHLGFPKGDNSDPDFFKSYSKEMLEYGKQDVRLNKKVYDQLLKELASTKKINPLITKGLAVEIYFAKIESLIRYRGWDFDERGAKKLLKHLEKKVTLIEETLNAEIGLVCVPKDSKKKFTTPVFTKKGHYAIPTARWFDIPVEDGLYVESLLEPGASYCRVEFLEGKASSDKVLKQFLYSIGWVPDDWNIKKTPKGQIMRKTPKLTDSSLEPLGDIGKMVIEYNSLANRYGILKGWIEEIQYDGRLHGRMWTIGTPTFRCRHEVVANLPTVGTSYGREMRSLLLPPDDWVIIGADSAGNQMRAFCWYVDNPDFTKEAMQGDIHTKNANLLRPFMLDMKKDKSVWANKESVPIEARENRAKRFLYALTNV